MKTIEQIKQLGWGVETDVALVRFRASQGNFQTPWRDTPEQMLADVQKITECRKGADKEHLPF